MAYKPPVNPEIARIQTMIQNNLMEINKRYTEIGRIVKLQCLDQVSNEDVKRMASEIDSMLEDLKSLNTQLDTVNGIKTCVNPACCCKIDLNMIFCPNCGTKQPLVQPAMPQQYGQPYAQQPYASPYQQPAPAPMPAPGFQQQPAPAPMPAPGFRQQPAPAPMPAPGFQQPAPAPMPAPDFKQEPAPATSAVIPETTPDNAFNKLSSDKPAEPEAVSASAFSADAYIDELSQFSEQPKSEPEPEAPAKDSIVKPFEMPKPVEVPPAPSIAPDSAPQNGGFIFCSQCGSKEPEGTRFCSQCGSMI